MADQALINLSQDGSFLDKDGAILLPPTATSKRIAAKDSASRPQGGDALSQALQQENPSNAPAIVIPPNADSNTHAVLTALQTLSSQFQAESLKNDNRNSLLRTDLRQVNERFETVEGNVLNQGIAIVETTQRVTVLEKQQKTVVSEVKNINQRVAAIEESRASGSSTASTPRPKTSSELLADEISNTAALLAEAKAAARIAVIGCHGRKEPTRQAILGLISKEASLINTRFEIRGLVARVTFDFDGEDSGPVRARRFVENINSRQSGAVFWAKVDEPRTLRDLKARARSFGAAVADSGHYADIPRSSIVEGFLIVGDVVVGPLTLIPGETSRENAVRRVKQILLDPHHAAVDYKEALEHQLRESIVKELTALHRKPIFVDAGLEHRAQLEESHHGQVEPPPRAHRAPSPRFNPNPSKPQPTQPPKVKQFSQESSIASSSDSSDQSASASSPSPTSTSSSKETTQKAGTKRKRKQVKDSKPKAPKSKDANPDPAPGRFKPSATKQSAAKRRRQSDGILPIT
jgi:hypothetical protein